MADPNREVIEIPLTVEEIKYFIRVIEKNMQQAVKNPAMMDQPNRHRAYKTMKLYEKLGYALLKLGVQK